MHTSDWIVITEAASASRTDRHTDKHTYNTETTQQVIQSHKYVVIGRRRLIPPPRGRASRWKNQSRCPSPDRKCRERRGT